MRADDARPVEDAVAVSLALLKIEREVKLYVRAGVWRRLAGKELSPEDYSRQIINLSLAAFLGGTKSENRGARVLAEQSFQFGLKDGEFACGKTIEAEFNDVAERGGALKGRLEFACATRANGNAKAYQVLSIHGRSPLRLPVLN
jgi:hypothetical protein